MTRREFISAAAVPAVRPGTPARVRVPVHRVVDARAQYPPERLRHFWSGIWPEAAGDFSRGGIELQASDGPGEVRRSPGDRPIFVGLRRGVINLVLTDHIPMLWDKGRALAGVSTIHQGYHVCMIALLYAHGNQMPFLSVNTCVHELLHVLLQDVFVSQPKWFQIGGRESRIDWYATWLWLFHDGAAIRKSAQTCLDRLRTAVPARTPLDSAAGRSFEIRKPALSRTSWGGLARLASFGCAGSLPPIRHPELSARSFVRQICRQTAAPHGR
jgi:hypothetical protein